MFQQIYSHLMKVQSEGCVMGKGSLWPESSYQKKDGCGTDFSKKKKRKKNSIFFFTVHLMANYKQCDTWPRAPVLLLVWHWLRTLGTFSQNVAQSWWQYKVKVDLYHIKLKCFSKTTGIKTDKIHQIIFSPEWSIDLTHWETNQIFTPLFPHISFPFFSFLLWLIIFINRHLVVSVRLSVFPSSHNRTIWPITR